MPNLFMISISSCIISYIIAIPFYLLVERPFKNFLDLVLFPKSSIFKRTKDIDDEDDEDEDDT
jgi:peptidoglycan/LPS O-acetylase OafA/YrhL